MAHAGPASAGREGGCGVNIPMLKKVRAAILKRPRQFEMRSYFATNLYFGFMTEPKVPSHCGTAACIAGWALHLESDNTTLSQTAKHDCRLGPWEAAKRLLRINGEEACRLFDVGMWPRTFYVGYSVDPKTRAKAAAARINHFIKTKGKE